MGRRIYYDDFLKGARYYPDMGDGAFFRSKIQDKDMRVHVYQAPTIEELAQKIKADGHVIWGKKIEDYNHCPENAYEYLLLSHYLKSLGKTEDEITKFMELGLSQ
jgi:hypothetical protein